MATDQLESAVAGFAPVALLAGDSLGSRLVFERRFDPLVQALGGRAAQVALPVSADPPVQDGRAYAVEGVAEPRCRPYLRVIEEESAFLAGPQVRFEPRDDGMYLTVKLEEDRAKRVAGALPFGVRVTSLALAYGADKREQLAFSTVLQRPLEDAAGPAFRVEAEAKVPADRQEQIVRDLQGPERAQFVAGLELDWIEPPHPTPSVIDLAQLASAASWRGGHRETVSLGWITGSQPVDGAMLPFNGSDGDSNGFVILSTIGMEDGSFRPALRTHPTWVGQGMITGYYSGHPLPPGARFEAQVGFVGGATGTDGVEFVVSERRMVNGALTANEILRVHKGYTGQLMSVGADLSHLAGQFVGFDLRVEAGPSSGQDWAAWVDPRIVGTLPPSGPGTPRTSPVERRWEADYPDSGRNAPVYAGVTGNFAQARWQSSQHGWFQPTALRDTVYCLPDAYWLHVSEERGLPSIQAVLLRKGAGSGALDDDLDAASYTTRLTLTANPTFKPGRLAKLRQFIRAQSTNTIKYADLAIGGYRSARFVADDALAGLGELFAGTTAGNQDTIDPAGGFSVTYEGNAEFIDLLYTRLKNEGIGGEVEFELDEPGSQPRRQRVPVKLSLHSLAPLALPVELTSAPPTPKATAGTDPAAGPGALAAVEPALASFSIRNPTQRAVTVASVQAVALQRSPVTGTVYEAFPAKAEPAVSTLSLEPGATVTIGLRTEPADAAWNSWDVELADPRPALSDQLVLSELFDAATSGVRGWKVDVASPPLQHFEALKPEEQAKLADVVAIEVEIRRPGSPNVEEVRLTPKKPEAQVLLSRTVADFISDRATGRSTFQWRSRLEHITSADTFSDWHEESGNALSVYIALKDEPT
jgi:hypothetical protein